MHQLFADYAAAVRICTPVSDFAGRTFHRASAYRTDFRNFKWLFRTISFFLQHAVYFRNDFPGFVDLYVIPFADILFFNEIHIMEGCSFYDCPCQMDRFKIGRWCQDSCPSKSYDNFFNFSLGLFRRVLVSHGPARILDGCAKLFLLRKVIDFYNHSVSVVSKIMPADFPVIDALDDSFNGTPFLIIRVYLEMEFGKFHQKLFLRGNFKAFNVA
ncbi:unknown [Dialister sp. CAG:357]|nr:unknown [Dialister sp. CAG:357]